MEYEIVILDTSMNYSIKLIEYTDEYKEYLKTIKHINSKLINRVEKCPKTNSELSKNQSYLIFLGENYCIGAIYICTSFDEKNIKIEIGFDEIYVSSEEIYKITDQIVDNLAFQFHNKDRIETQLLNNVDLSRMNKRKYIKKVYNENLITYSCINKYKKVGFQRKLKK